MAISEANWHRILLLAQERVVAKENKEWNNGLNVARESILLRGNYADWCWLAYFLYRLRNFQEALDAIDRAIQSSANNKGATMFRMRIIQEKEGWDRYTIQQRDRAQAAMQDEVSERRQQEFERQQGALMAYEAVRDHAQRLKRGLELSQFRDAESFDPYDDLHEIAEQAAGLARRPIADPSAGGERHTYGHSSNLRVANEYSGYDGGEEQDLQSNTYDPLDEE